MHWKRLIIILMIILSMVGCTALFYSKKPEGLNVAPILSIELPGDFKEIDAIKKIVSDRVLQDDIEILRSSSCSDDQDDSNILRLRRVILKDSVDRNITIYRFATNAEALNKYTSDKRTYLNYSSFRIYKEEGDEWNQYFSSYYLARIDFGHFIIPQEILRPADITVTFLKRNLIIVVSYNTRRDDTDYIKEINEDILYVGDILMKALGSK